MGIMDEWLINLQQLCDANMPMWNKTPEEVFQHLNQNYKDSNSSEGQRVLPNKVTSECMSLVACLKSAAHYETMCLVNCMYFEVMALVPGFAVAEQLCMYREGKSALARYGPEIRV